MKITNKSNLPKEVYKAVRQETYISMGDVSVTSLIDSPRIWFLKKQHQASIQLDAEDLLASLEGTALHHIMELADIREYDNLQIQKTIDILEKYERLYKDKGEMDVGLWIEKIGRNLTKFKEQQFSSKGHIRVENILILNIKGWDVKGQFDRVDAKNLVMKDFKSTTVWSYKNKLEYKTFNLQQNIYRYMLYKLEGIQIMQAYLIFWYRDWQKSRVYDKNYPPHKTLEYEVPIMSFGEIERYLEERVELFQRVAAGENYQCTAEERWAKPDLWKIYKKGGKRALVSIFDESMVEQWKVENAGKYDEIEVKHIPGYNKRCEEYCPVAKFCNQFKQIKDESKRLA